MNSTTANEPAKTAGNKHYTLTGFADEISPDPIEQLRVLSECGIRFLDLRKIHNVNVLDLSLAQIQAFQKTLSEFNIRVACIGSPIGKIDIVSDDLDAHFHRFQVALDRARQFETKYIRIFSFHHKGQSADKSRDAVFFEMDRMIKAAAKADLILLHENEKGIYGDTAARCQDLLETFPPETLQAIFDPANFVQCDENMAEAWQLLRDRTTYFHIKDALASNGEVVPAGEGDGQIEYILRDALKRGFTGFASLEPHLDESHGADGAARFKVATNAIRKILEQL